VLFCPALQFSAVHAHNKLELKSLKRMSEDQQGRWQLLDRWGLRISSRPLALTQFSS
jgi:hypothetical protein